MHWSNPVDWIELIGVFALGRWLSDAIWVLIRRWRRTMKLPCGHRVERHAVLHKCQYHELWHADSPLLACADMQPLLHAFQQIPYDNPGRHTFGMELYASHTARKEAQ